MTTLLTTDAYKFSMAQAGFPLREETFYLSFRRGGWQYVPFDLARAVRSMLPPATLDEEDAVFLAQSDYSLTSAMRAALAEGVRIAAVPEHTWVFEREPILTITGPSFLVSWLEPLVIRLFFPIQLATEVARGTSTPDMFRVTCEEQAQQVRAVLAACGVDAPHEIVVDPRGYAAAVDARARELIEIVGGPERLFEVGMRAASCEEEHRLALAALREAGIVATSNVAGARALSLRPVGTMGHEHVQRWGNDIDAYRAMRDMRVSAPSYLLDTFDTIGRGIPAAIAVMKEREHDCSIRYDSGDKYAQYMFAHGEMSRAGLSPTHILEDGLTAEMTRRFEELRSFTKLEPSRQLYGYGGWLIAGPSPNPLSRDRVSAVYKLAASAGEARMKFGNEQGLGKVSVPGEPVVWRRLRGSGPIGVIAQASEPVPEDYVVLNDNPEAREQLRICNVNASLLDTKPDYELSAATRQLVSTAQENR